MTSNTDSGYEEVCFTVAVRGRAHAVEVDTCHLTECGQLVYQRNVDVAIEHAEKLGHFGGFDGAYLVHRRAEVFPIKRRDPGKGRGVESAHDLWRDLEARQDKICLDPLGAVRNMEVRACF